MEIQTILRLYDLKNMEYTVKVESFASIIFFGVDIFMIARVNFKFCGALTFANNLVKIQNNLENLAVINYGNKFNILSLYSTVPNKRGSKYQGGMKNLKNLINRVLQISGQRKEKVYLEMMYSFILQQNLAVADTIGSPKWSPLQRVGRYKEVNFNKKLAIGSKNWCPLQRGVHYRACLLQRGLTVIHSFSSKIYFQNL